MRFRRKGLVCALAAAQALAAFPAVAQEKAPPLARGQSQEERQQVTDIVNVPSATRKLQLLTAFVNAHPAAVVRARLLAHVGIAISREPDVAVRVTLAENFAGLMTTDSERIAASTILTDAYLKANRVDEAFQAIAVLPGVDSLDPRLLARLASAGADQARARNLKHLMVSRKYGEMAIRAIEADQMPSVMSPAAWKEYKGKALPFLHQSLGLLTLFAGSAADAVPHLTKAIELAPDDFQNFTLLGAAINEEYTVASQQLKQMQPGPQRDAQGKKTFALLSRVIDTYAHAVALSAGTPQEQAVRAQVWADLENYYKFLHNGTLEGLQALIDKYKKQ